MAAPSPSNQHMAAELLQRAHSPETAETILRERVRQRPLLLRPTSPDPQRDARSQRRHSRLQKSRANRRTQKPKSLTAREKRALGIYDIAPEHRKYTIYEPLHRLWCGYMREILAAGNNPQNVGPLLTSADYHGALVEVVRSRCVSRVGLKGLVVKDTKFTFEIVTERDELKVVPKEHTIFRIEISREDVAQDGMIFELHGNQFESRAPDRANRKFRWHYDPDL